MSIAAMVLTSLRRSVSTICFPAFDVSTPAGRSKERYRRALLASFASVLARLISIGAAFISVPLTLQYLGAERYGLWMTISAAIGVLGFSDLGISNGLLNGIAKAHGKDDRDLARQYVSSAFFLLLSIALLLGTLFALAYPWIDWTLVFRVRSAQAVSEAGGAVAVFTGCFLLGIPAGIASRVQSGYQEGFVANLWTSMGSVFCLLSLLLVIHFRGSLPLLVLAMSGGPILALLLNGAVQFGFQRPWLMPSHRYVTRDGVRDLLHLGFLFFVLQLGGAIAFSSDNFVLTQVLGPEAVAEYAVPCKLFALVSMASSFIVMPLWPAYREAMERWDHQWIRRTLYRSISVVSGISVVMSVFLFLLGNTIIHWWVGPGVQPSPVLLAALGLWGLISGVGAPISIFLNGLGVLRFQIVIAFLGAASNIGLSIYLTRRIGVPGVVFGSILSQVFVGLIPYWWYVRRYLKNGLPDGCRGAAHG